MIETAKKEDLFLDPKLIKSVNKLGNLRIIDELHPVLGGQPTHEKDQPNDNNPVLDLACTTQYALDEIVKVNTKADTKLAKAQNLKDVANVAIARDNLGLGTSATMNATSTLSDRTDQTATIKAVNDVNRDVVTAQKTANNAHALAQTKQDKLEFVGGGKVMKEGAFGIGTNSINAIDADDLSFFKNLKTGERFFVNSGSEFMPTSDDWFMLTVLGVRSSYKQFDLLLTSFPKREIYHGFTKEDGTPEWNLIYTSKNTGLDKSGFLRGRGNANALVESDVTNSLGNSKSLVASQALVNSLAQKIDDVPVDKIFAFDSATPPKGYIARNGQAIDKNTMPKLYTRYGANMPDDRDRALRMSGVLAGNAGSTQEDSMQRIEGFVQEISFTKTVGLGQGGVFSAEMIRDGLIGHVGGETTFRAVALKMDSSKTTRTSTETRVKSRIVILCNKIQ